MYTFALMAAFEFGVCGLAPSYVLEGITLYSRYADKQMPTARVDTAALRLRDIIKAVLKIRIIRSI